MALAKRKNTQAFAVGKLRYNKFKKRRKRRHSGDPEWPLHAVWWRYADCQQPAQKKPNGELGLAASRDRRAYVRSSGNLLGDEVGGICFQICPLEPQILANRLGQRLAIDQPPAHLEVGIDPDYEDFAEVALEI